MRSKDATWERLTQESPHLAEAIGLYLDDHLMPPGFGGVVFTAYAVLGAAPGEVYVWAFAQEFYDQDGSIGTGSGLSCPAVVKISLGGEQVVGVAGHRIPRDGELYAEDVKNMFPESVQHAVLGIHQSDTVAELRASVEERARAWFGR